MALMKAEKREEANSELSIDHKPPKSAKGQSQFPQL
jgi:hypothetical protein